MSAPLIIGLEGISLTPQECEFLSHPAVGGVILFSRNYQDPQQLTGLCQAIHAITPDAYISVDHEGGRVQRFRQGFTEIAPMADLGRDYDKDPEQAKKAALGIGRIIGQELAAVGVNMVFAPVLDIAGQGSEVIGDRAFHHDPQVVGLLASALVQGIKEYNVIPVGKHFPGHGSVQLDTHQVIVVDQRDLASIASRDLSAFEIAISEGLPVIMTSHIVFPKVDAVPVTYSKKWLRVLRERYHFSGMIVSDDLGMAAAMPETSLYERAQRACAAGCDKVLLCNELEGIAAVLAAW